MCLKFLEFFFDVAKHVTSVIDNIRNIENNEYKSISNKT